MCCSSYPSRWLMPSSTTALNTWASRISSSRRRWPTAATWPWLKRWRLASEGHHLVRLLFDCSAAFFKNWDSTNLNNSVFFFSRSRWHREDWVCESFGSPAWSLCLGVQLRWDFWLPGTPRFFYFYFLFFPQIVRHIVFNHTMMKCCY